VKFAKGWLANRNLSPITNRVATMHPVCLSITFPSAKSAATLSNRARSFSRSNRRLIIPARSLGGFRVSPATHPLRSKAFGFQLFSTGFTSASSLCQCSAVASGQFGDAIDRETLFVWFGLFHKSLLQFGPMAHAGNVRF